MAAKPNEGPVPSHDSKMIVIAGRLGSTDTADAPVSYVCTRVFRLCRLILVDTGIVNCVDFLQNQNAKGSELPQNLPISTVLDEVVRF